VHHPRANGQATPSSVTKKTIRFADDLAADTGSAGGGGYRGANGHRGTSALKPTPTHNDRSVERYFDNLISMIEDAAEGL